MLCSKLHCQIFFKLILFSYEIHILKLKFARALGALHLVPDESNDVVPGYTFIHKPGSFAVSIYDILIAAGIYQK